MIADDLFYVTPLTRTPVEAPQTLEPVEICGMKVVVDPTMPEGAFKIVGGITLKQRAQDAWDELRAENRMLSARIAELEKEVERAKALPMNYRRMEFNAQLQDTVAELTARFDMAAHLRRQREWSARTFGPDARVNGVVDHIRKELVEILAAPDDISEWIDVVILALDGAWRAGYSPEQIIAAMVAKQTKNEGRICPDWRAVAPDSAIEHVRTETDA